MVSHSNYDVLLSYKAENANVARSVAEHLMSCGLSVWFAEYAIRSTMYENDAAILGAIRTAVLQSRCYVLFTNHRWARSKWCQAEMKAISETNQPKILQVYLPRENEPLAAWPSLRDAPSIHYRGYAPDVIGKLRQLHWVPGDYQEETTPPEPARVRRKSLGYGITLDPGPFRESEELPWFFQNALGQPGEHHYLQATVAGRKVHLVADINPHRTVLGQMETAEDGVADDRNVYRSYIGIAHDWMEGLSRKEVGLHLVFLDGRSHFAMTSASTRDELGTTDWERRYALLLKGPDQVIAGELDLTFGVSLRQADSRQALREFLTIVPAIDRMVESFQIRLDFRPFGREWWGLLICRLAIAFLALIAADILSTQAQSSFWKGAGAMSLGIACAAILLTLIHAHTRWEADRWGVTIGPRIRFMLTLGGMLDRVWNRVIGGIAQDVHRVGVALSMPPAWLLVGSMYFFWDSLVYWFTCGLILRVIGTTMSFPHRLLSK